jgi:hypothetical protein
MGTAPRTRYWLRWRVGTASGMPLFAVEPRLRARFGGEKLQTGIRGRRGSFPSIKRHFLDTVGLSTLVS